MYEPAEDSFLMEKHVKKFAKGRVLEIGCGSGILMEAALTRTKEVYGADIDKEALDYCKGKGLNVKESDLFSNVFGRFDFIIFNPPYLPSDEGEDYRDLIGGKEGYEIIERFFKKARKYLNKNGEALIIFSNLTNKDKVDAIIKKEGFEFELLEEKNVGLMEKLFVYLCYAK